MTAIVAIKKGDRVWMGADTMSNNSYIKESRRTPKIFKVGPLLIGVAGTSRVQQLLRYNLEVSDDASIEIESLVKEFIPVVRELFLQQGVMINNDGSQIMVNNSTFLIAGRSGGYVGTANVVQVDIDFQVVDHLVDYWAIGSGAEIALGSLFSTTGVRNPIKRIKKALMASEYHSPYVGRPFTILEL